MTVLCEDNIYWYALRVTYGREKKAYDYLVSRNVEAYYLTLETVKVIDGLLTATKPTCPCLSTENHIAP